MKNCILYLIHSNPQDIKDFKKSLTLIKRNYLNDHPCDVVCLHEPNFPKNEIKEIQLIKEDIIFSEITFDMPDYPAETLSQIPEFYCGFSIGYRHMCRLFAGDLFNKEIVKNYKYIWRLDCDSFILTPIKYNLFDRMASTESIYGYIAIEVDHPDVEKGLWEISEKHFRKIGKDKIFKEKQQHFCRVFYSNFEVLDVKWFQSAEYQEYYSLIDESAGIYKYRWGDHVIRYLALNSLLEKNKLLLFHDILYRHARTYINGSPVKNTRDSGFKYLTRYEYPDKMRLGKHHDGGYVIADGLEYDLFLSAGISGDISFEHDFLNSHSKIKGYAFDGTIDVSTIEKHKGLTLVQKNISSENTETTENLSNYLSTHKDIFLKMDIEGAEYPWILSSDFTNVKQMAIEFHVWGGAAVPSLWNCLKRIDQTHCIIHIHVNNNQSLLCIDSLYVPEVFEVTFLRKHEFKNGFKIDLSEIPAIIDMPNDPSKEDVKLVGYPYTRMHK